MARKRINIERLSSCILVVLYREYEGDREMKVADNDIRSALPDTPLNAFKIAMSGLVKDDLIEAETRRQLTGSLGSLISGQSSQGNSSTVRTGRYQITKSGIDEVDSWDDDEYEFLESLVADLPDREPNESPNGDVGDEWEPIPVDLSNDLQKKAVEDLETAASSIEADNGYAATQPAERNAVVRALRAGIATLREEAEIQIIYFKAFIWEPLEKAGKKFGESIVGLAIQAAKESIKEAFKQFWDQIF